MVTMGQGEFSDQLAGLASRINEQKQFFQGALVTVDVGPRVLDETSLVNLQSIFDNNEMELRVVLSEASATQETARRLKLGTRMPGSGTELVGGQQTVSPDLDEPHPAPPAEMDGLLIRGALRSGRVVTCPGHVTVIGDVNPGAEIIAGGDVVVWGKLRGLVHAGAYGDRDAIVCALELTPTQLRISDLITVSPPGPRDSRPVPEMASIRDGQITAESWDAGYRGRR